MNSILNDIKKLLGIDADDDSFDKDIMLIINSIIPSLSQIGIGPASGFIVLSAEDTWKDYLVEIWDNIHLNAESAINYEGVKVYIYLRTKLIFDPPTNTTVIQSIKDNIKELEWRMMLAVETNNLEV
jgi:hypothetical protein